MRPLTRDDRIVLVLIALVAAVLLVNTAWIADDALITLRQVQMTAAGEGIVWNPGQRVQAFTHPAWFGLLVVGQVVTGSSYLMALALAGLCTAGALVVYVRFCWRFARRTGLATAFALLPLAASGFTDYAVSGLENGLSFLLAALIASRVLASDTAPRTSAVLWLLLAISLLTRQDHALQFGPLALWLMLSGKPWPVLRAAVPGLLLLLAWFAFATFYFGAPLPNTYYAKLHADLPPGAVWPMTQAYVTAGLLQTPVTLILPLAGIVAGLFGSAQSRALSFGIALHLAYLASIGGDFMQGRMLSVDAFLGAFLLVHCLGPRAGAGAGWRLVLPVVICLTALRVVAVTAPQAPAERQTITDERAFYYPYFGLLGQARQWPPSLPQVAPDQWRQHVFVRCGFIGLTRIRMPGEVHVVDHCGLADPFLSRMPMIDREDIRAGHFVRRVPRDYPLALESGDLAGFGADTKQLFQDIWRASSAPLLDPARLAAIWRLNTASYNPAARIWRDLSASGPAMVQEAGWLTDPQIAPDIDTALRGNPQAG